MPVSASATALTDTTTVKRYLRVTASTDDDLIQQLINQWSARIEKICGRAFHDATYTENISGTRARYIVLRQYPVVSITSLKAVYGAGTDETTETIASTDYRLDLDTGIVHLISDRLWPDQTRDFARGFRNYRCVYVAGYTTIPEDVAQVCAECVADSYGQTKLNAAIKSESLGDYSYTLVDQAQLSASQAERLRPYTMPRIGGWML